MKSEITKGRISAVLLLLVLSAAPAFAQGGGIIFKGKGNCFTCHGAEGKGTPLGPNLTDTVWLNIDGSQAQIEQVVRTGVPKPKQYPAPMPPMGGAKLSAQEISAVAHHVLMLSRRASLNRDAGNELSDRRYAENDAGEGVAVLRTVSGQRTGCADRDGCKHCGHHAATAAVGKVHAHRH